MLPAPSTYRWEVVVLLTEAGLACALLLSPRKQTTTREDRMRLLTWAAIVSLVTLAVAPSVSARVVRMESAVALADDVLEAKPAMAPLVF